MYLFFKNSLLLFSLLFLFATTVIIPTYLHKLRLLLLALSQQSENWLGMRVVTSTHKNLIAMEAAATMLWLHTPQWSLRD